LRNELVSNNLADFRLRAVRERFQTVTARFAGFQAQWLNPGLRRGRLVDFPLLQRLALPITIGAVRYRGIKILQPMLPRTDSARWVSPRAAPTFDFLPSHSDINRRECELR